MRVMGVDPGLTRCGMALIETDRGRRVDALDVDVVRTSADTPLPQRLKLIHEAACEWMDVHQPDVIAVERVFAQNQRSTAMGTAQAGGVVALAAAYRGIDVAFHTPSEVKAAITGNGRADKKQMTTMITRILGLQKAPEPADAADALALAVCHAWRAPAQVAFARNGAPGSTGMSGYEAKVAAALAQRTKPSSKVRQRPSNKLR